MEFKNDNEKALNLEGTLFIHFLMQVESKCFWLLSDQNHINIDII